MKNISLLPPEIRARQQARRKSGSYIVAGGAAMMVFLAVYGILMVVNWQAQNELRELRQHRAVLEQMLPAYQQFVNIQKQVETTDRLLKEALETPPDWLSILTGAGLHMPNGVWLTDLTVTYKPGELQQTSPVAPWYSELPPALRPQQEEPEPELTAGSELTMRGAAVSHAEVARWLEDVRSIPELGGVFCQFAGTEGTGQAAVRFEIKATVWPGAAYQPPAEGV